MGHTGLARRWHDGRRLIHDNGITYNIYSDPQNNARPWQLDPIPLVMDPEEWKSIEAGIIQRAMLFNAVLAGIADERHFQIQAVRQLDEAFFLL